MGRVSDLQALMHLPQVPLVVVMAVTQAINRAISQAINNRATPLLPALQEVMRPQEALPQDHRPATTAVTVAVEGKPITALRSPSPDSHQDTCLPLGLLPRGMMVDMDTPLHVSVA